LSAQGQNQAKPVLWSRNFVLISLATFFIFCAFQILLPVIPKFAASLGADRSLIGLISGVFTITAVSLRPFIGRECDSRGRKSIYLTGLLVFLAAIFGYLWVPSLLFLALLRVIHGAGWAGVSTAAGTIVSDIIPPQRRGEGMGYYGLFSTLSMAIAPAVALTLLPQYGFSPIYLISLVLAALAMLAGKNLVLPATPDCTGGPRPALFERRALKAALVLFFMTLTYGGIVTFLPLYAEELGITNVGPFFTVYALALMAARPLSGKYYDLKGPKLIVLFGLLCISAATFLLSSSSSLGEFFTAGILYGVGFGSVHPTMMALAIHDIEPQRRGAVNGMIGSAFDLGIGLGSVLLGLISAKLGFSAMYLYSSFTPLIGIVLFFLWHDKASSI